jgi:hypothetical protein
MLLNRKIVRFLIIVQISIYISYSLKSLGDLLPFYFTNTDPAYEYLINGVNLNYGVPPGHADHPGSTVQWLVFLTNKIYQTITTRNVELKVDFVSRPEHYAIFFSLFTILLHSLAMYLLTNKLVTVYKKNTFIFYPTFLLLISYPFIDQIVGIKPENLLIIATSLLLYSILHFFEFKQSKNSFVIPVALGAIFAFGVSTKFTFILFAGILLFIKNITNKIIFVTTSVLVALVINIKLMGVFSFTWFINIIFYGGRYGQDRPKDYLNILVTLKDLVLYQYQIIGIIAILSIYIATNRQSRQNIFQIKALKIYSFLVISGIVLIVKESLPRDFLFISPILVVILLILVTSAPSITKLKFFERNAKKFLAGIAITFIIGQIILIKSSDLRYIKNIFSNQENEEITASQNHKLYENRVTELLSIGEIVITDYDAPTQFAALQFGNVMYGESSVRDEIDQVYPTSLHVVGSNIYNGKSEIIGCQLFPNFENEGRDIYLLTRSGTEFISRINSSIHGFDWQLSENFIQYKETGLDWKIYKVLNTKCRS